MPLRVFGHDLGMRGRQWTLALMVVGSMIMAACSSTTPGSGVARQPTRPGSSTASSQPASDTPAPTNSASASTTPSVTIHEPPATPLRTKTVHSGTRTYVIKVWFDINNATCADHAYGAQMIAFLQQHKCFGLKRILATTVVNGQEVGFNVAQLGFPGTSSSDPYGVVEQFRNLVNADGTGNINDLLREGYRLPSGPTSVPSPDAFKTVGQDEGIEVYDMWYLSGPTPNNDPVLLQMAQDIFLQY